MTKTEIRRFLHPDFEGETPRCALPQRWHVRGPHELHRQEPIRGALERPYVSPLQDKLSAVSPRYLRPRVRGSPKAQ
jgi:hypothetical protein